MWECPNCGAINEDCDDWCSECGYEDNLNDETDYDPSI